MAGLHLRGRFFMYSVGSVGAGGCSPACVEAGGGSTLTSTCSIQPGLLESLASPYDRVTCSHLWVTCRCSNICKGELSGTASLCIHRQEACDWETLAPSPQKQLSTYTAWCPCKLHMQ